MIELYEPPPLGDEPDEKDDRPAAFRLAESAAGMACDEGAALLRDRIAARQWAAAPAVSGGEQPIRDPDARFVAEVGDGYRLYVFPPEPAGDVPRVIRKLVVNGFWHAVPELE